MSSLYWIRPPVTNQEGFILTAMFPSLFLIPNDIAAWAPKQSTGLPRSGKSQGNSSLSQSQGKVREFCCKSGNFVICYQSQGKVREFRLWSLSIHIFQHLSNDIWIRKKSLFMSSFKYHSPNVFFSNFIFSCDQAALRTLLSGPSVQPSICLSVTPFSLCSCHRSSWNFQEWLPMTKVMYMQKVQVRGQMSRPQRSKPNAM